MMETCPEKSMTLQFGQSRLIRTPSSMPVIFGIITSVIRRSGDSDCAALRAARGSAKERASNPRLIKMSSRVEAMTFSSSTTNTRRLRSCTTFPHSLEFGRLVSLPIGVDGSYALLQRNSVQNRTTASRGRLDWQRARCDVRCGEINPNQEERMVHALRVVPLVCSADL
jgi:hypothetical protein